MNVTPIEKQIEYVKIITEGPAGPKGDTQDVTYDQNFKITPTEAGYQVDLTPKGLVESTIKHVDGVGLDEIRGNSTGNVTNVVAPGSPIHGMASAFYRTRVMVENGGIIMELWDFTTYRYYAGRGWDAAANQWSPWSVVDSLATANDGSAEELIWEGDAISVSIVGQGAGFYTIYVRPDFSESYTVYYRGTGNTQCVMKVTAFADIDGEIFINDGVITGNTNIGIDLYDQSFYRVTRVKHMGDIIPSV